MAKVQAKMQGKAEGPEDGLREKMIAINRVTKVVKGEIGRASCRERVCLAV